MRISDWSSDVCSSDRHVASGLRFPAEFAGYTRLRERAFDPGGEYIAVGYDRPLGTGSDRIVVRIAVVHLEDMSAHDHFEIMRQSTMSHFSAPTLLSPGPTKIPNQRRLAASSEERSVGYADVLTVSSRCSPLT